MGVHRGRGVHGRLGFIGKGGLWRDAIRGERTLLVFKWKHHTHHKNV